MNRKEHSSSMKNRKRPTWNLNLWSQSPACSSQTRNQTKSHRESPTASLKASESWLCWKYSPLVTEIKNTIWFICMQSSPFPISTLLLLSNLYSKITCFTWRARTSRQGVVKTSIWGCYKYCTVQVYNIQYFLESYNLNVFFWLQLQVLPENCAAQHLKNTADLLYHASTEKAIVLARLIKSIYLLDNLQLLAICRLKWITSLIFSVSIPKDPWYGVRENIFLKRYY